MLVLGALLPFSEVSAAEGQAQPPALSCEFVLGDKVAEVDPFLGDWEAASGKDQAKSVVAQVIPRGLGTYRIHFQQVFDQRCPLFAEVDAKTDGAVLRFDQGGWSGRIEGGVLQGTGRVTAKVGYSEHKEIRFELKKAVRPSPRLGASPPEGSVVLYGGKGLDNLESDHRNGLEMQWQQLPDCLRIWPPLNEHDFGAALRTRQGFPNFRLHLEFRLPLIAEVTGQSRANSGIIIEDYEFYELQILDSYGLPGYWDECGAIYNKEAPKVNACRPPGQWQSYDVTYHGPRLDSEGKLTAPARITVDLNGKVIHRDVDLPYSDRALQTRRDKPGSRVPGRLTFQNHGDPVDFRNIWIQELKD